MLWQLSPSVIAELIASAILLLLAIYFPWRDLSRQARLTSVTLIFVCALWMLSNAIEIGFPVASYKESLVGVQLVLGAIALTLWLLYILHYLGPKYFLARRIYILLGIVPLVAVLALSTNNAYGLMWTEIGLDSQNPYLPLQPNYGVIYWVCMVYLAILTLTGSFIIIWSTFRRRYSYSRESIYLLLAAVLPVITAFIEVAGLTSSLKLPVGLSPWASCIGSVIIILNLPRFYTEQVIPIARNVIFDRIGDCIIVLDLQDRVLDLNPAAEQLIGYRISDAFGLPIERIWPHQSNPPMPFNKIAEAGEELVLERDGKQRAYDLHISTVTDSGGRLISQVILFTDITERKRATEALRESGERFRNMVNLLPQVVFEADGKGNFTFANRQGFEIFGFSEADVAAGLSALEVLIPQDRDRAMENIGRHSRGESFLSQEYTAIRKDGSKFPVEINTAPIIINSKYAGMRGIIFDNSERKRAEAKLLDGYHALQKTLNDAIDTMAGIVEMRDPYTAGHQRRVAKLATAIAEKMKWEDSRIDKLRKAAVIHDIGKINVPSDILVKQGKLEELEFELIKRHAQSGYDIVKGMDFDASITQAVLQHHERLDGSGYPNHLKGEDILLEAKIIAMADVVEAMSTQRPYRPALGIEKALEEIADNRGRLYDPDVVDACLELFNRDKFRFESV